MLHIPNNKIYPTKVIKYNPRTYKLIVDSINNYKLSIILTNYNINHNVCENTVKYGQRMYTSYTTKYTNKHSYNSNDLYFKELTDMVYNDIEDCKDCYPECYINIFTQKEYNSIEETYMVSEPEPDQNMYLNI